MSITPNKIMLLVVAAVFAAATSSLADEIKLPDMGSPADAVLSKNDEAQIGAAIMRRINASDTIVKDPQVVEYVNEIGHRVGAHANNGDYKFTFFVVDDPSINGEWIARFGPSAIPMVVVLDSNGRELGRSVGYGGVKSFRRELERMIGGS